MQRIAVFPGSFDPFTLGHKAIVEEAIDLFDRIIIGVGYNNEKRGLVAPQKRVRLIEDVFQGNDKIEVKMYRGLTADFCRECGATFLLRGVRNAVDFEYEHNIADINRMLTGIDTLLLISEPEYAAISSSMVRELAHFGKDISKYLPVL